MNERSSDGVHVFSVPQSSEDGRSVPKGAGRFTANVLRERNGRYKTARRWPRVL